MQILVVTIFKTRGSLQKFKMTAQMVARFIKIISLTTKQGKNYCVGLSRSFTDCHERPLTFKAYHGLSWTAMHSCGLSRTVMVCH